MSNSHSIYEMRDGKLVSGTLYLFIEGRRWMMLSGGDFGIKQATIPVGSIIRIPESDRILSRQSPGDLADGVFYINLNEMNVAIAKKFVPDARKIALKWPRFKVESHSVEDGALQMSVAVGNVVYRPSIEIHNSLEGNDLVHEFNNCLITDISKIPPFISEGEKVEVEMAFYGYRGILIPKDDPGECYE